MNYADIVKKKKPWYNLVRLDEGNPVSKKILKFSKFISNSLFLACALLMIPLSISKFYNTPIYINPTFYPYLEEFKKDSEKYKTPIDMYKLTTVFKDKLSRGIAAYCVPSTNSVVVSRESWEILSSAGKKALLYHEWAHCTLRRDHTEDRHADKSLCPKSIMYPYITDVEYCFDNLEEEYIEELFTNPYNYEKFLRRK